MKLSVLNLSKSIPLKGASVAAPSASAPEFKKILTAAEVSTPPPMLKNKKPVSISPPAKKPAVSFSGRYSNTHAERHGELKHSVKDDAQMLAEQRSVEPTGHIAHPLAPLSPVLAATPIVRTTVHKTLNSEPETMAGERTKYSAPPPSIGRQMVQVRVPSNPGNVSVSQKPIDSQLRQEPERMNTVPRTSLGGVNGSASAKSSAEGKLVRPALQNSEVSGRETVPLKKTLRSDSIGDGREKPIEQGTDTVHGKAERGIVGDRTVFETEEHPAKPKQGEANAFTLKDSKPVLMDHAGGQIFGKQTESVVLLSRQALRQSSVGELPTPLEQAPLSSRASAKRPQAESTISDTAVLERSRVKPVFDPSVNDVHLPLQREATIPVGRIVKGRTVEKLSAGLSNASNRDKDYAVSEPASNRLGRKQTVQTFAGDQTEQFSLRRNVRQKEAIADLGIHHMRRPAGNEKKAEEGNFSQRNSLPLQRSQSESWSVPQREARGKLLQARTIEPQDSELKLLRDLSSSVMFETTKLRSGLGQLRPNAGDGKVLKTTAQEFVSATSQDDKTNSTLVSDAMAKEHPVKGQEQKPVAVDSSLRNIRNGVATELVSKPDPPMELKAMRETRVFIPTVEPLRNPEFSSTDKVHHDDRDLRSKPVIDRGQLSDERSSHDTADRSNGNQRPQSREPEIQPAMRQAFEQLNSVNTSSSNNTRSAGVLQPLMSESLRVALQQALDVSRKRMVDPGELRMTFPLGDLGTFDIDIVRDAERFSIRIAADPQALALMEDQRTQLTHWLRTQGYPVEQLDIIPRFSNQSGADLHNANTPSDDGSTAKPKQHSRGLEVDGRDSENQPAIVVRPSVSGARVWTA